MPRTANPAAAYWLGFSAEGRRARRCGCLGRCAVVLRAGLSALGCAGWCGAAGGPRPGALLCAGLAGLYSGCSAAGGFLGGRQRGGAGPLVHGGGAGCRGTGLAESHRAAAACLGRMDRPIAAGPGSLGAAVHCRTASQSRLRPPGSTEKALLSPPTAEKSGKIKKIWKKPVAKEVEDII